MMVFSRSTLTSFAVLTTVLVSFSRPYSVGASDAVDVSTSFVQQKESLDEQDKPEFGHAVSRGGEGGTDDEGGIFEMDEEELSFLAKIEDQQHEKFLFDNSGDGTSLFVPGEEEDDDGRPLPSTNLRGSSANIISTDSVNLEGYDESTEDEDRMFLQVSSDMQKMLDLVNHERTSRGIRALCFNSKLNKSALAHSIDMRDKVFFNHKGSNGSSAFERMKKAGYNYSTAAENISSNRSIENSHRSLMNSPGHRTNILNSRYAHIGIGITKYTRGRFRGNYVITQNFGSSSSEGCSGGGGGGGGGGSSSGFSRKFMLINSKTNKALDVSGAKCDDKTNIHLWHRNGSGAQIFHYHYATKAIVNVKCNKAIDINAYKCYNGNNIQLYRRNGTGAQQFQFMRDGRIESIGCAGKSIDIYKGLSDNGTNIQIWSRHGGDNQKWKYVYV